jgi:3-oxoadipate enol-lactonase
VRTRYARNGQLRIAYELRGVLGWRRPWLVLIQGVGFDRHGWEPVSRTLQRHFCLALVDNRGIGRSDLPVGPFSVADMAGDVVAVLDDAGIRRAHVMGVSLGGMMAQELAAAHPERVDGLVLVSTMPGWPFAFPMPAASMRLLAATRSMSSEVAARRNAENVLSASTIERQPEVVDRLVELQRSRPADSRAVAAQAAAGARYAGRRQHARIRARTLVVQGTADTVVGPANGKLLANRIPGAQLVIFPDLGHLLFWQDPDGFATAVISFLLETGSQEREQPAAQSGAKSGGSRATVASPRVRAP